MIHLLQIKIEGSEPHSPYPPDMSMNDDDEMIRVNIIYIYICIFQTLKSLMIFLLRQNHFCFC